MNLEVEKFKMLAPYVLVKRMEPETTFKHLMIVLPEQQNYKNRKVVVVKTYEGRRTKGATVPCSLPVGSVAEGIVFDPVCTFRDHKNEEYEVFNEDDILAYYEPENNV